MTKAVYLPLLVIGGMVMLAGLWLHGSAQPDPHGWGRLFIVVPVLLAGTFMVAASGLFLLLDRTAGPRPLRFALGLGFIAIALSPLIYPTIKNLVG